MLDKLFHYLQPLIRYVIRAPLTVIGISVLLAAAGFLLATNLRIDTDLSRLIPEDYPSVIALNKLREQVGGEHEAAVAVQSPSFEANRRFAEELVPRALTLKSSNRPDPFFARAELRKEIEFLKDNALYFATDKELDLLEEYLNAKIDEAKEEANPFYFELEEDASAETDSLGDELNSRYDELVGSEYTMSEDSTILVVKLYPTGAQTDIGFIREAYEAVQNLINEMEPSSYHPDMEVAAAGRLLHTLVEVQTITRDVKDSFGAGVLMLMIAVVLYFLYKSYRARAGNSFTIRIIREQFTQIPSLVLIIGLPLALSLCYTFGIAYLSFGNLNIMTSTLGLLLFGMGIDFGIHFFARYSEERAHGSPVSDAILTTFRTTGQAIFAVGVTTAAAFFILMLADFKGFSEFGYIAGLGLLFAILTYLVFLPALIVILEKSPLLNLSRLEPPNTGPPRADNSRKQPAKSNSGKSKRKFVPIAIIAASAGITLLSIIKLGGLSFEYDFSELEPVFEEFRQRNRLVSRVYSDRKSRNAAYIIVDEPSEAEPVADLLRERAATDTASPTIREVEVFQDRYPMTRGEANEKLARLERIRQLMNDPFIRDTRSDELDRLRRAAGTRSPIPLEEVPEFLKAPFTSTSGTVGHLVIIYPSVGLSDGRNSMDFADDVGKVTLPGERTYYAGSTSIVASDMLRLMIREAPVMILLTVAFIIVFKMLILHRVKWMLLALLPLAASFFWLFGLMETIGWKLNFYNLVVLPTILGIGDDSGIHIVHRYLEEGTGSVRRVIHSTGEHVTVSTLTTMLGFGGLLFSIHPGLRSIGEVAVLGILLTLFAALFLLPSLLKLLEKPGVKPKDSVPATTPG